MSTDKHNNSKKKVHVLWTREETQRLETLIAERCPVREIAQKLKKSEKGIRRKCEWLCVSSSTTYRPREAATSGKGKRMRNPERIVVDCQQVKTCCQDLATEKPKDAGGFPHPSPKA